MTTTTTVAAYYGRTGSKNKETIMNAITVALKWNRREAGDYTARYYNAERGGFDQLRVVLVEGNWILRINGVHEGYFGRLGDAKAHATAYAADLAAANLAKRA